MLELPPKTMGEQRIFRLSQVAQHKSNKDCWMVINGRILNVIKFLEEHPEGEEVLIEVAGKDATEEFEAIGHSRGAKNWLLKYQVGVFHEYTVQEVDSKDDTYKESNNKEMSAIVVKDDAMPKSKAFSNFLFRFLLLLYFGYRCLAGADQIAY